LNLVLLPGKHILSGWRLLAAALGSMLDAFDAMYYSQIPLILS